jgi:hypothetical protein
VLAAIALTASLACGAEDFVSPLTAGPAAGQAPDGPVTIDHLLELRDLGGISVSPDGNHVAFQLIRADAVRNTYDSGWYVMKTRAGAAPVLVGPGGQPALVRIASSQRRTGMWLVLAPRWSPDGRHIAYLRREGDVVDAYRSAIDGSTCERLTAADGDVEDLAWRADGQAIIYREGPSRRAIAAAELEEGRSGYLLDDRFDLFHSFQPIRHRVPANPSLMTTVLGSGKSREASSEEAALFASNRVVHFRTPQGTGRMVTFQGRSNARLPDALRRTPAGHRDVRVVVPMKGAAAAWLEPAEPTRAGVLPPLRLWATGDGARALPCDSPHCAGYFIEMAPVPDASGIFFVKREGWGLGTRGVYFWNLRTRVVRQLAKTDDLIMDCTPLIGRAICVHEGPLQPRRIVELSLDDGHMTPLFDPNPEWQTLNAQPATKLHWTSTDGRQIFGRFVPAAVPDDTSRMPLVVVQYRAAGFLRGGVGDEYPVQAFAANGISVLVVERPDPFEWLATQKDVESVERLEWKDLNERRRGLAAVDSGLDLVLARYAIDPARIGITGLSDGGETTNFALIHSRHAFAAAAISGGSRDPSWYYYLSDESRARDRGDGLGPIGSGADWQWAQLGLAFNVERVRTPLLMQVADRELLFGLTTERTLKEAGKAVELYIFPDEYHVKWQAAHRRAIYDRNVDWMNFWLRGVASADPKKKDQFERWQRWRRSADE